MKVFSSRRVSDSCSDNRQSKIENLKSAGICAIVVAFALCGAVAQAQQTKSVSRIGFLSRDLHPSDSRAAAPRSLEAFRQSLRELGYVEGKNIIIEYRYAEERLERLPALAEELVRLKVEIIVADTAAFARAAKKATSSIPIVMASAGSPIQDGLVASLARPGGNVTGLTNLVSELVGKRLELLKEVVPKVSRFAYLDDVEGPSRSMFMDAQLAAQSLGVKFERVEVKTTNPDFDGAFRVMVRERIGGLVVGTGSILGLTLHRRKIVELAEQNRLPTIYASIDYIDDGGLMYYGANIRDLARRGATYVDKILKGVKPADLPIEERVKSFVASCRHLLEPSLTFLPPMKYSLSDSLRCHNAGLSIKDLTPFPLSRPFPFLF